MCLHSNGFQRRYHMTYPSFKRLVWILDIHVDEVRRRNGSNGNDLISSEMIVVIGLRFMGGEKMKSLADIFGTSQASIPRVINKFLLAVDVRTLIGVFPVSSYVNL